MGAVFSIIGGIFYWLDKIVGIKYPDGVSRVQFITMVIGVNLTFFPMHFLGLGGMPRRYIDYPDEYAFWNEIASIGSLISAYSFILLIYIFYVTITKNSPKEKIDWVQIAKNMREYSMRP